MQNFCDIKQVVELLNMQPSKKSQYELRYGKRGSLSVDLKNNVWFDHEHMVGGGILDLVVHHGSARDKKSAAKFCLKMDLLPTPIAPQKHRLCCAHTYTATNLVSLFVKRLSTKMGAGVSTGVSMVIGSQL